MSNVARGSWPELAVIPHGYGCSSECSGRSGSVQPARGRRPARLARLLGAAGVVQRGVGERRGAWRWEHRSVQRFERFRSLTGWDHPVLAFGVCPARGTLTRLDRAFGVLPAVRAGETRGVPAVQERGAVGLGRVPRHVVLAARHHRDGMGRVYLKGVGAVRFRGAKRGWRGEPKTLYGTPRRATVADHRVLRQRRGLSRGRPPGGGRDRRGRQRAGGHLGR